MKLPSKFLLISGTLAMLSLPTAISAQSLGDIIRKRAQDSLRQRGSTNAQRPAIGPFQQRTSRPLNTSPPVPRFTPEQEKLAEQKVVFSYSDNEIDRLRNLLSAREARARRFKYLCDNDPRYGDCPSDLGGHVARFYDEAHYAVAQSIEGMPATYDSLKTLRQIETGFEMWARYENYGGGRAVPNLYSAVQSTVEARRSQIEPMLRTQITADLAAGKSGLMFDLFGIDRVRESFYQDRVARLQEAAQAPSGSTSEGKILNAALQALYSAPSFAIARGMGAAEKRPESVRIGAMGSFYDYTVKVRNATCKSLKAGTTCDYEMNLGLVFAIAGMKLPTFDTPWITRRDVFQNANGGFSSSALTQAMNQVAATQSSQRSSSVSAQASPGTDFGALQRAFQDVNDGLYSTGRVIY